MSDANDCYGRESAATILERYIKMTEEELRLLKALHFAVDAMEVGSDAEVAMWKVICSYRLKQLRW